MEGDPQLASGPAALVQAKAEPPNGAFLVDPGLWILQVGSAGLLTINMQAFMESNGTVSESRPVHHNAKRTHVGSAGASATISQNHIGMLVAVLYWQVGARLAELHDAL